MDFDDENLAEAYGLARVAHDFDAEPEMTQFQRDVVKNLVGRTEWIPTDAPRTATGQAGPIALF